MVNFMQDNNLYSKGDRVIHPKKEDWGIGEVLDNSNGKIVSIYFENAGKKQLSLEYVQPVKVDGKEAKSNLLDNLSNTHR